MATHIEIVTELKRLGVGMVGEFIQGDAVRMGSAGALITNPAMSPAEGYCHGVCLDWARRVLQKARPSFDRSETRFPKTDCDYHKRVQDQAQRQGFAWARHKEIGAAELKLSKDATASFNAYVEQSNGLASLQNVLSLDYNAYNGLGDSHTVTINYGAQLHKYFPMIDAARTTIKVSQLLPMIEMVKQAKAQLVPPVGVTKTYEQIAKSTYTSLAAEMDVQFLKKRKFGGITLKHLSKPIQFPSLSEAIESVTNPAVTGLQGDEAMLVGFKFVTTKNLESGHAIAVYHRPNNTYLMLDPNFGIFFYNALSGDKSVESALTYLCGTAYPEDGIQVTNEVTFEIFARSAA